MKMLIKLGPEFFEMQTYESENCHFSPYLLKTEKNCQRKWSYLERGVERIERKRDL